MGAYFIMDKNNRLSKTEQQDAIQSFRISRVFLPILLGIVVVVVLFYRQFDPEAFEKINWSVQTLGWVLAAIACLAGRVLCYAARIRLLTDRVFSWTKSIQIICIWEFSSAVSPTNVGGSAVAFFILAKEGIAAAKTTSIVIYAIILDTLFMLMAIPIWILVFGTNILGPSRDTIGGGNGWMVTLITAYVLMALYGAFFIYGLFFRPRTLQQLLKWISRIRILRKYRTKLEKLGTDIMVTSKALAKRSFLYHLTAFMTTVGAWSFRFLLIICLIIGITNMQTIPFSSVVEMYARIQTMFVIMAVSPTPGGVGFAEVLFGSLLSDFVPAGISLVVATIWRILAYYFFLIVGVIIIPSWLGGGK